MKDTKPEYRVTIKYHDGLITGQPIIRFSTEYPTGVDDTASFKFFITQPLFSPASQQKIDRLVRKAKAASPGYRPPQFSNYRTASFTSKEEALDLLVLARADKAITAAYLETSSVYPPGETYQLPTQDLSFMQPAPIGLDIGFARQFKGGRGEGDVCFIDIESGWIGSHEKVPVKTLPISGINHPLYQSHGIAVLGILLMQHVAGTGIAPLGKVFPVSPWREGGRINMADAILASIDYLHTGDILLLESQAQDFVSGKKFPIEIFDANFELIRLATALGIIVVEPAGNGNANLDLYRDHAGNQPLNAAHSGFKDSGAIMVAAATSHNPHTKMPFSNYGSRVNCFAWGHGVTTACVPHKRNAKGYTTDFTGTSAASAIIAGVALLLQSIAEQNLHYKFTASDVRLLLTEKELTTPSAAGISVNGIGVMPDLRKLLRSISSFFHSKTKRAAG